MNKTEERKVDSHRTVSMDTVSKENLKRKKKMSHGPPMATYLRFEGESVAVMTGGTERETKKSEKGSSSRGRRKKDNMIAKEEEMTFSLKRKQNSVTKEEREGNKRTKKMGSGGREGKEYSIKRFFNVVREV